MVRGDFNLPEGNKMFSPEMKNFTNPLPQNEVHFIDLKIEPWEDKMRFKVFVQISEFLEPPNLNFYIYNENSELISEVTLIENVDTDIVFTMHLRNTSQQNQLKLLGEIFYSDEIGKVDTQTIRFTLKE
jgi:hypothetical protein